MQSSHVKILPNSVKSLPFLVLGASLFYLCTLPWTVLEQGLIYSFFSLILFLLTKLYSQKREFLRPVVFLLAIFISFRYIYWRATQTLFFTGPIEFGCALALFAAELYSFTIFVSGTFVGALPIERNAVPFIPEERLPSVDVFIPTYDEPIDFVITTAIASTQIDYPREKLNIYVLDDGSTEAMRNDRDLRKAIAAWRRYSALSKKCKELGITYLSRKDNTNAKAGNINAALKRTRGDLILVLDCDHVPSRDFLKNIVGFFDKDPKLYLVQTPHFFINPNPIEKNLSLFEDVPSEHEMFYRAIQTGLDLWNASFFCGSAALLRRSTLESIGGIQGQTVTEDAETAIDLHRRGYNSIYFSYPMICGLSPETFSDFIAQRIRWARGMTQIFILKNPLLQKGLTVPQKLCYLNSTIFWFFGIARIIFLLAPLLYLFFGLKVYMASVAQVLAYALPHLFSTTTTSNFLYSKVRWPFFSELYEMIQSYHLTPSVIKTIFRPKAPKFNVTPKGQNLKKDFLSPIAMPFYLIFLLTISSFFFAVRRWIYFPAEHDVIMICTLWGLFNFVVSLCSLGIVWEKHQVRRHHRIWTSGKVILKFNGKRNEVVGELKNISLGGMGIEVSAEGFRTGQKILVKCKDSWGLQYVFHAKVARITPTNNGKACYVGVQFNLKNGHEYRQAIAYVYGDSTRWREFWEMKRRPASVTKGMWYLLLKGIEGARTNFSSVIRYGLLEMYRALKYGRYSWMTGAITQRLLTRNHPIWKILFRYIKTDSWPNAELREKLYDADISNGKIRGKDLFGVRPDATG